MFDGVTGLTGGMGSGKSTVSRLLPELGYQIVDADLLTRKVHQNREVQRQLMHAFGDDVVTLDGEKTAISRSVLAKRAFADEKSLHMLNEIMQPALRNAAKSEIAAAVKPVILDAPLLFEAGWLDLVDRSVVVFCPYLVRFQRIFQRDRLSPERIRERIEAQISDEMRCQKADYFIYNCASLESLKHQVLRVFA